MLPTVGPITGPMTTAMPKIDVTRPCCRFGKVSSRMVCDSGITGAPSAPCRTRHRISVSSESARPHIRVVSVKASTDQIMVSRRPKRAASQPVIGVATAVARMLKVMAQAISSWVADMVPCICGSRVEAISRVVA